MFDALEDTPREFQLKLVDALNSLGETMQVPPTEAFNKVLCKSDDENEDVKKKLYNWWRAFFEVLGKCEKIPNDRKTEFNQKIDDLMAEIMKAGDAESTDEEEPVMESSDDEFGYQQATKDDEDKMLANMEFAVQHIGEVANKVKAVVNFINPYCGTEVNESDDQPKFKVGDVVKVKGVSGMDFYGRDAPIGPIVKIEPPHPDVGVYEYQIKGRSGEFFAYEDELELFPEKFTEENDVMDKPGRFGIGDHVLYKGEECVVTDVDEDLRNDEEIYQVSRDSDKVDGLSFNDWVTWDELEPLEGFTEEENNTMKFKKIDERIGGGDSDEWVSMNDYVGEEFMEAGQENLDAEGFIEKMTNGAGATPLFDPYNGEQRKDGTVVLNVIAHREQVSYKDVANGLNEPASVLGWKVKSFGYSDDVTSGMVDDGNVEIDVVFAPMQQVGENLENELKKGDDGWTTIGQPVGESKVSITPEMKKKIEEYALRDWRLSKWKSNKGFREIYELTKYIKDNKVSIKDDKIYVAGEEVGEIVRSYSSRRVNLAYQELKPKIKWYDNVVSEAKVVVDANDVWDVLDLLDNEIAHNELTDLINSHVRTEEEIMDAINELSGPEISKKELNTLLSGRMATLVDYLGLDVGEYENMGNFKDSSKPTSVELEGSSDEIQGGEVKDGEKQVTQDGDTKTLVAGEGDTKKPVCEMTIEQEIDDPWKLSEMLWSQGKENLEDLLRSELVGEEDIMMMLEDMGLRNLTNINDAFAFDFPSILDSLGLDAEAWSQNLKIKRKSGED